MAAALAATTGGRHPRRVGLLALRTLTAYAGYLAVQRLGATVVPLHPGFPPPRTAATAKAAALDCVLADPGHAGVELPVPVLAADVTAPGHDPEDAPDPDGARDREDARGHAGPDDICYILFTSGSTGTPKGVPIRHRNVSAYLDHVTARYGIGVGDRLSQTFDLTFDLSVFDLFAAWSSGATVVVPDRADLLAPRFVARERITHWFSVPSVISLARRLRGLAPGSMPTLRWSLFCGEPLTTDQAATWQAAAPDSVLENLYGPTELTLSCTQYRLPATPADPLPANGTVRSAGCTPVWNSSSWTTTAAPPTRASCAYGASSVSRAISTPPTTPAASCGTSPATTGPPPSTPPTAPATGSGTAPATGCVPLRAA
ncbi:AMP-binding protein [Streptomyces tailanensis]|uniref:AMP-binding protein n=1 Tax=Streptomyces tailanensis TaxID=2569858 RepID=UPI00319E095B